MGILRTAQHRPRGDGHRDIARPHPAANARPSPSDDVEARSFLLGDFHVCLVEAFGNRILADILRDLTARTVLISALYQSTHDATESCDEHEQITDAARRGRPRPLPLELMVAHIGTSRPGSPGASMPTRCSTCGRRCASPPGASGSPTRSDDCPVQPLPIEG